jgi:hypothetical protein
LRMILNRRAPWSRCWGTRSPTSSCWSRTSSREWTRCSSGAAWPTPSSAPWGTTWDARWWRPTASRRPARSSSRRAGRARGSCSPWTPWWPMDWRVPPVGWSASARSPPPRWDWTWGPRRSSASARCSSPRGQSCGTGRWGCSSGSPSRGNIAVARAVAGRRLSVIGAATRSAPSGGPASQDPVHLDSRRGLPGFSGRTLPGVG